MNQNFGLETTLFDAGVFSGVVIATVAIVTPYVLAATAPTVLGDCEEDPSACEPPTPAVGGDLAGLCECPTAPLIDTSGFFSSADLTSNIIDSNTIVGLDNGMQISSENVNGLIRAWVGLEMDSGPSGTGTRFWNYLSSDTLMQARVDYGEIGPQRNVYRLVLEEYLNGAIPLPKIHLPIVG